MREVIVKLYKFDELPTEKAKDKARDWYRNGALDYEWWDATYEDAKNVGLKITSFDTDRNRHAKGSFIEDARDCAHKIIKDHGPTCETFKTATAFLEKYDEAVDTAEKDEDGNFKDEYALDQKLDGLEAEFLKSILEDYAMMLEKEAEYLTSDESVDESIRANEYEFTEDGKRCTKGEAR